MRKRFSTFLVLASSLMLAFAEPVITEPPHSQIVNANDRVAFGVVVSGAGPFSYQWQHDGTNLPSTNIITTVAGSSRGFSGDGGAATNAQLNLPNGVAVDASGNIFIADTGNHRVRKVDTNGIISTVAGNGQNGFTGDDGPATNARLTQPFGVAIDALGNLFISDGASSSIRKVDANGMITTLIGTNGAGYGGDNGPADAARISGPRGIAFDRLGNLLIADSLNFRIRKIDTNGIITTVAGTNGPGFSGDGGLATSAHLNNPQGVAADVSGNLFVADTYNYRIRKVDTNGVITTVAGTGVSGFSGDGGSATSAQLWQPARVAAGAFGDLLIADTMNQRIRKVDMDGMIFTLAGTNGAGFSGDNIAATNSKLNQPLGMAVDPQGNLLIADSSNDRIRKVSLTGAPELDLQLAGTNTTGGYRVIVTSLAGSITSSVANLSVVYTLPPTNSAWLRGATVSFAVAAYGDGPFYYQWYAATNSAIANGTNDTLILTNVQPAQSGGYYCVVSNSAGSVTGDVMQLSVSGIPPSITAQPVGVRVALGAPASLQVTASGDLPLDYQWFTSSGRSAEAVPVVTSGSIFSARLLDSGMGYVSAPAVKFVGGSGSGAAGFATLYPGGDAVMDITMTSSGHGYAGVPPVIQIDPPPIIAGALPDETNATLSLPAVTAATITNYFVVVTNSFGSVTSSTVVVTAFLPPENFTAQRVAGGAMFQLTGSPLYRYSIQAATNLTPPIQWQSIFTNYSDMNGNWQYTDTNIGVGQKFYRAFGQ